MKLEEAIDKLLKLQAISRQPGFIDNPSLMSQTMARMSSYAGAVEANLAEYEKDYRVQEAEVYHKLLIEEKLSASAGEKHIKIELGHLKGQIAYLTRIVSSAWSQIGVCQSRINHIVKLIESTNV